MVLVSYAPSISKQKSYMQDIGKKSMMLEFFKRLGAKNSSIKSKLSFKIGKRLLCFVFLISAQLSLWAQYDTLKLIKVEGILQQQMDTGLQKLPNAKVKVKGVGRYTSDEEGVFSFEVPVYDFNRFDAQIEVEIQVDGYDIISPLDGLIEMDTADFQMTLDLMVVGDDLSASYRAEVDKLNRKLQRLKQEQALSVGRLNAMNNTLLENIKKNEYQKKELETSIANLNNDLAKATEGNAALKQQLSSKQTELAQLSEQVVSLNNKLMVALEEKYLRQQQLYKSITADLKDYLIRTKDVHELLEHVKEYFPTSGNPDYVKSYNSSLLAYNKILTQLNEQQEHYVKNVARNWKSPIAAQQLDKTFQILFDQLHYPKLQPSLSEINGFIRKRKVRKADQVAHAAFHDMYPIILNLEKSINKTTAILKDSF
jgi:hypothetical protein